MMDDNVELTYKKKKKQRRIRCIAVIVAIILVFVIGFLIGYFAKKSGSTEEHDRKADEHDMKAELQKRHEEIMNFHKTFQSTVAEEQLESNLK